jgi:hypothetical protein
MEGAANGYRQSKNVDYGDPEAVARCEGVPKRLAEMLFIYTTKAFHYEGFPTNPLGKYIEGVETNLQRLWGGTGIEWYTGVEVDQYFLSTINKHLEGTGAPCFNNRDRTWFAGVIKTGLQFIEDEPRQMMTLLVQVPFELSVLEQSDVLLSAEPPEAINILPRPTTDQPELCAPIPDDAEAPVDGVGCAMAPAKLTFMLPATGTKTVTVVVPRLNGSTGTLTVPHADSPDTALEGTHYNYPEGNLVFATGEQSASFDIELLAVLREEGDPAYVQFSILWDNDPEVLCEGSVEETVVCLGLAVAAPDPASLTTCPDPLCANCDPSS